MPQTNQQITTIPLKMLAKKDKHHAKWYLCVFIEDKNIAIAGWGSVSNNSKGQWKHYSHGGGIKKIREKLYTYSPANLSTIPEPAREALRAMIAEQFSRTSTQSIEIHRDKVIVYPATGTTTTNHPRRRRSSTNTNRRWL